ncbi:MAG: hypothetical protein JWP88_2088 [Flaviaesturariibacter sp.]|nr:hypothetical protein [Flaviaesturariibacter sp.]
MLAKWQRFLGGKAQISVKSLSVFLSGITFTAAHAATDPPHYS